MNYLANLLIGSDPAGEMDIIKTSFVLSEYEIDNRLYIVMDNKIYMVDIRWDEKRLRKEYRKGLKDVSNYFSEETLAKLLLKLTLLDEKYFSFIIFPPINIFKCKGVV